VLTKDNGLSKVFSRDVGAEFLTQQMLFLTHSGINDSLLHAFPQDHTGQRA